MWYTTRKALVLVNAMQCTVLPHIMASVFINDDERGLHADYEKWLEEVCTDRTQPPTHRSAIAGPGAGCTTAPAQLGNSKPLS